MAQFILKVNGAKTDLSSEEEIQKKLEMIQQSVLDVSGSLNFKITATAGIKKNLTALAGRVEWHKNAMGSMKNALGGAISLYEKAEKDVCGYVTGKAVHVGKADSVGRAGATISPGAGWSAGISLGPITVSVAESDIVNLLNSKVGKTVIGYGRSKASWFDRLCDKASSNYEEYKAGEISGARAIVETLMETAIEAGKGKLVNGLVTAAFSAMCVTSPPGIVVTAVTTGAIWGLDWISEKLTGKKMTEAVSDFINRYRRKNNRRCRKGYNGSEEKNWRCMEVFHFNILTRKIKQKREEEIYEYQRIVTNRFSSVIGRGI